MSMFGGLIHCVRTFGNQIINGIKTFTSEIYVKKTSTGTDEYLKFYQNNLQLIALEGSVDDTRVEYIERLVKNNKWLHITKVNYTDNYAAVRIRVVSSLKNLNIDHQSSSIVDEYIACQGWVNQKLLDKTPLYPDYSTKVQTTIAADYAAVATVAAFSYTCATNGYAQLRCISKSAEIKMFINGITVDDFKVVGDPAYGWHSSGLFPVKEGDVITFSVSSTMHEGMRLNFYSDFGV